MCAGRSGCGNRASSACIRKCEVGSSPKSRAATPPRMLSRRPHRSRPAASSSPPAISRTRISCDGLKSDQINQRSSCVTPCRNACKRLYSGLEPAIPGWFNGDDASTLQHGDLVRVLHRAQAMRETRVVDRSQATNAPERAFRNGHQGTMLLVEHEDRAPAQDAREQWKCAVAGHQKGALHARRFVSRPASNRSELVDVCATAAAVDLSIAGVEAPIRMFSRIESSNSMRILLVPGDRCSH